MKCLEKRNEKESVSAAADMITTGQLVYQRGFGLCAKSHKESIVERLVHNHPVPLGRVASLYVFPGTSCRDFGELSRAATFVQSLRDEALSR